MNVSKQHREDLLRKIQQIRTYIASAQQDQNTGHLLQYLDELTKDVKGKKYGLVFEQHKEKIDETLETHTPVLTEQKNLFIDNGGEMNFLIEGDNLAALQLLEKTHKGKIDVIYIDPPYNTGNEFVYNDDIIDSTDTFRHSKWCSFMLARLNIAQKLLSKNGIIFISIDDHEQTNLKLLCDSVFSAENFIDALIWKKTENIKMDSKFLSQNKDYVLIYRKSNAITEFRKEKSDIERFKLSDERGRYYLRKLDSLSSSYSRGMDYVIVHEGSKYYPGGSKEKWQIRQNSPIKKKAPTWLWSKEKVEQGIIDGEIIFKNGNVYNKVRYDGKAKKPFINIQTIVSQQTAQKDLDKLFNERVFDHPKPIELIIWLVSLCVNNNSSTILDFFAGSGTTGHAVMKLNAEDGGKRKFILCTNNENNICRDVTYERLKTVITGKRKDGSEYGEKYDASLKYYKIDFVKIDDKMYYEYADELLLHIRELVELENGINFNGDAEIAIVLTDAEMENFVADGRRDVARRVSTLYRGHDVLMTAEQEALLQEKGIKVNVIPDYYYNELNR